MDFQQVIMRLQQYWADQGCLIWQPYNVKVGAGTMNPATFLRVLGPEPWKVAYVEPSVRPADGRFGENPNRWGQYYQFQVILKPDPGNPVELYLGSLRALGIDPKRHDVRLVEDNWQSPALAAWGLGWEVWLDGQEISQYTYFQQAGGFDLDPVSVEITYGLERIVMVLQDVPVFQEMTWTDHISYGDILLSGEIEQCRYSFNVASIPRLREIYDLYEAEARDALEAGLVVPAHDYVLQCSHIFNVLDARGAVGVTERAGFFARMRDLSRAVAEAYLAQRKEMGFPLEKKAFASAGIEGAETAPSGAQPATARSFLLEAGTEELPAKDLSSALQQLGDALPAALDALRLAHGEPQVFGTPRRIGVRIPNVAPMQEDREVVVKGPPVKVAFDAEGKATKAALGFARSNGVSPEDLQVKDLDGREYVVAVLKEHGLPAAEALGQMVPDLLAQLHFPMSMRWNRTQVSFSRPIRWLVAMLGDAVVPCVFAGVASGRVSRGIRPDGSPSIVVSAAEDYQDLMRRHHVMLGALERREVILDGGRRLAREAGGMLVEASDLLDEVANMVEWPLPISGCFAEEYLHLPEPVLVTVMREHQRYFPVSQDGRLLPAFVTIANGADLDVAAVRHGNEDVLRARYADAAYFYRSDRSQPLAEFVPRLATLTFQTDLGSMLDKVHRLERLAPSLGRWIGLDAGGMEAVRRAAFLSKADLGTKMVVEHTSLQGVMGAQYARLSGEPEAVAEAIAEQYLPRGLGDALPETPAGTVLALADRFDSLVGLFAAGLVPTGSADPYALRRAALGIIQILLGKRVSLPLSTAVEAAAEEQPVAVSTETRTEVCSFIHQRLRGFLLDQGYRYDVVDAVLAEQADEPVRAEDSVRALEEAVALSDWGAILRAYARAVRITRGLDVEHALEPELFSEVATGDLYAAYAVAAEQVTSNPTVEVLVQALRELAGPINRFFDKVLVMAKEPDVRNNRLALLQRVASLTDRIADLSLLEGF